MSYYDLDDIMATNERIPCRFNMTVPGLGYLEGNPGKPIEKGTKVELPFWLAEVLAVSGSENESFIDLLNPDLINHQLINAIKSDSVNIDLHSILSNYYILIEKWCDMFQDRELSGILMQMLKERCYMINNYANNTNANKLSNEFLLSLDAYEKKLFKLTSESNKQLKNWLNS